MWARCCPWCVCGQQGFEECLPGMCCLPAGWERKFFCTLPIAAITLSCQKFREVSQTSSACSQLCALDKSPHPLESLRLYLWSDSNSLPFSWVWTVCRADPQELGQRRHSHKSRHTSLSKYPMQDDFKHCLFTQWALRKDCDKYETALFCKWNWQVTL